MSPTRDTDSQSKPSIRVDDNGQPIYCIHLEKDHKGEVNSFLIPESKDEKMQFIQEVCNNTSCEVLVLQKVVIKEADIDEIYPIGYFRHSGNKRFEGGKWMYKLIKWRNFHV